MSAPAPSPGSVRPRVTAGGVAGGLGGAAIPVILGLDYQACLDSGKSPEQCRKELDLSIGDLLIIGSLLPMLAPGLLATPAAPFVLAALGAAGVAHSGVKWVDAPEERARAERQAQIEALTKERLENLLRNLEVRVAALEKMGKEVNSAVWETTKMASEAMNAKKELEDFKAQLIYDPELLLRGCAIIVKDLESIAEFAKKTLRWADTTGTTFKEIDTRLSRCASVDDLNTSDETLKDATKSTQTAGKEIRDARKKRDNLSNLLRGHNDSIKSFKQNKAKDKELYLNKKLWLDVYVAETKKAAEKARSLLSTFTAEKDSLIRSFNNLTFPSPSPYADRHQSLYVRAQRALPESGTSPSDISLQKALEAQSATSVGDDVDKFLAYPELNACEAMSTGPVDVELGNAGYRAGTLEKQLAGIAAKRKKCAQKLAKTTPAVGSGIKVVAGTYGGNCGQPRGNKTEHLAKACNGRSQCVYTVDHKVIGDPAYGCVKNYVAEWQCGSSPAVLRAVAGGTNMEAGRGSKVTLSCVERQ